MKAESLIFDIDGTLWDSTELVAKGYNRHLERIGLGHLAVTGAYLKGLFGRTMTEIADVIFAETEVPRRYEIMQACMDEEHVVLEEDPCEIAYEGVAQTVEKLANAKSDLAILHRNIAEKTGFSGAVNDFAVFQDNIIHG